MSKKRFKNLYHEVFDENGNHRLTGREKCKELIHEAKQLSTVFGNEETGMMNSEAIHALYTELFPNSENDEKE